MSQVEEREHHTLDETPGSASPGVDRPGRHRRPGPLAWLSVAVAAVAIIGLAVVSALFVSDRSPTVYGARVEILFAATSTTSSDVRDRILATQQELLGGRAVLLPVARSSGLSLSQLQDKVSVEIGRDDLLRLTVADESQQRALAFTRAIVDGYLALGTSLPAADERARRLVLRQIRRLEGDGRAIGPVRRERITRLQDRLLELDLARTEEPKPQILTPPYSLDSPLAPQPVRAAAIGLMVGLLVATGTAVLMVRRLRLRAR